MRNYPVRKELNGCQFCNIVLVYHIIFEKKNTLRCNGVFVFPDPFSMTKDNLWKTPNPSASA